MDDLFNKNAGFITDSILKIPNRRFIPKSLIQVACTGRNLNFLGCKVDTINAGSINFNYTDSLKGALGEFVERYSASLYRNADFHINTYQKLKETNRNVIDKKLLRYYSKIQYDKLQNENICPLGKCDLIEWVKAYDYINSNYIYVPAYSIYMPYFSKVNSPHDYMKGATSTGLAAGSSLKNAVISGFFECAERHAFSIFWYRQNELVVPQYSSELICKTYKYKKKIQELYNNKKVRLKVFDLSYFFSVETIVTFLYFEYKGKIYQSLGAASRFNKIDAIIKAAIEAYQGIEYAISLNDKNILPDEIDLDAIDDFDKHFHFYNKYPEYREKSVILQQAYEFNKSDKVIYDNGKQRMCNSFSREEIKKTGLPHLIYYDITPIDIQQINYQVARVITPTWNLLTGIHNYPFLGNSLEFNNNLFTELPHPFP